jgi:hypothetical protein
MSNATKLAAALSVAGAMLASSPASFAQERLTTQAYVTGVYAYGDCYYNLSQICPAAPGAYAAIAPRAVDAYAAVDGIVQPPYLVATPWWRLGGLRGNDWVAIHGANF